MDRIALSGESKTDIRIRPARPFGNMATSPMSISLRHPCRLRRPCWIPAACAAPPPRRLLPPLRFAPPPKLLGLKTQLENHM